MLCYSLSYVSSYNYRIPDAAAGILDVYKRQGQIKFLQMNAFFLEFFELVFRHIANLSAAVLSLFFDDLLCAEILGFNSENLCF